MNVLHSLTKMSALTVV